MLEDVNFTLIAVSADDATLLGAEMTKLKSSFKCLKK